MWHDIKLLNACASFLNTAALLALLAAGGWWLAQQPMFTLREVRVEAMEKVPLRYVSALTIQNTAVPRLQGNFFTTDLNAARHAFESVPWVRAAAVRRVWPNKLVVTLEEHVPLATWGEQGRLVSVKGDVFTANLAEAEEEGELPHFNGPDDSARDVVARYADLTTWLAPAGLKPVALNLSARYAWSAALNNGVTLKLGREQNDAILQARVARLVEVYPQLLTHLQDRIDSVDMRYPNGLALKARGLKFGSDRKKK